MWLTLFELIIAPIIVGAMLDDYQYTIKNPQSTAIDWGFGVSSCGNFIC